LIPMTHLLLSRCVHFSPRQARYVSLLNIVALKKPKMWHWFVWAFGAHAAVMGTRANPIEAAFLCR